MHLRRLIEFTQDESGQTTAFFVGIVLIIFGFMAFAFDTGFLYHARRVAQNAADPAALAGASELPGCGDEDPDPLVLASDYATKNLQGKTFASTDEIGPMSYGTFTVDGVDFPTVYAFVNRDQRTTFSGAFGLAEAAVPAEAEAACLPGDELGICPFYIQQPDADAGPEDEDPFGLEMYKVYRFKLPSGSGSSTGGNRGFLSIYGNGGNDITDAIRAGCIGDDPDYTVEEGQIVTDPKPGNMGNPTWSAIDYLYDYEGTGDFPTREECDIDFDVEFFEDDTPQTEGVFPDDYDEDDTSALDALLALCARDPDEPPNNISGRLWPIAISNNVVCSGRNCDIEITHIAMMYVACWGPDCDDTNPGQASLFGMFVNSVPAKIPVTGISNNPLAPKRPVLIK